MKNVYRVLAYAIAAFVAVQSATVAFAMFGLFSYIEGGGAVDKASMESESANFTGDVGFMLHGMGGMTLIPLLALLLLIVSFFAKIPSGVTWALIVLSAVVVQVALGLFAFGTPILGILHGVLALVLFGLAWTAAQRVRGASTRESNVDAVTAASR